VKQFLSFKLGSASRKFAILLLTGDFAFVLIHLLHKFSAWLPDSLYSLTRDGGYAEFYQYTKELWIILLLVGLSISMRRPVFASFAGLFSFFLLDDYFQIHEKAGLSLANFLQIQTSFGLRPQDFGELAIFGFFGMIFALVIALTHYGSDSPTRLISWQIIGLVVLLAVFGIVFDMLEISVDHPLFGPIFAILDDGGELLVMSVIAAYLFDLSLKKTGPVQAVTPP